MKMAKSGRPPMCPPGSRPHLGLLRAWRRCTTQEIGAYASFQPQSLDLAREFWHHRHHRRDHKDAIQIYQAECVSFLNVVFSLVLMIRLPDIPSSRTNPHALRRMPCAEKCWVTTHS